MLSAAQLNQQMINQQISSLGAKVKEQTDSRSLLQRFRKMALYRLLKANNIDVDENMEHEKMLNIAMGYEDKLDFSKVEILSDGFGGFSVRKSIELVKEEQVFDKKVQEEKTELKELTRPELMKKAKEMGHTVTVSMTSLDLIDLITGTLTEKPLEQSDNL